MDRLTASHLPAVEGGEHEAPSRSRSTLSVALVGLPVLLAEGLAPALSAAGYRQVLVAAADQLRQVLIAVSSELVIVVPVSAAATVLPRPRCGSEGKIRSVVLVLPDEAPRSYADALRDGAAGLVCERATRLDMIDSIDCAGRAQTLLPQPVARFLAQARSRPQVTLTARDQLWLRQLAVGDTIACLARRASYSERQMYRLLAALYDRLGASVALH